MLNLICKCSMLLVLTACQAKSVSAPGTDPDPQPGSKVIHAYYVAGSGSDNAIGTKEAPLKSITKGLEKAATGDTVIVRGGEFHEKIAFPHSGMASKPIVLMAYPGEVPVIDGTGLLITGQEALVTISGVSHIVVKGFDICHYTTSAPSVDINGIIVSSGANDIQILNNRIYNIENNAAPENGRSGHAILIIGNTGEVLREILVDHNEIHDCNTGYSENLTVNGYVDGFVLSNNKIYNAENIGIVAAGGYAANPVPANNYARNGIIKGNEVYNIDGTTGPIPAYSNGQHGAIAIYVDGARNITVDGNKVHDSDRGIGIVSENDGFPTEDCLVRNNFVYNCFLTGIYLGGYLGYTGGGTRNCYVVNNTLFQNNRLLGYYKEIEGEIRMTENCFDNIIQNNIIYGRKADIFLHKYTATGSGNRVDYNLYFSIGPAKWIWDGVEYTDFDAWRQACGGDQHGINGLNPLLKNIQLPDLHITAGSPASLMGTVFTGGQNGPLDIDGNPRLTSGKIDIGATQLP